MNVEGASTSNEPTPLVVNKLNTGSSGVIVNHITEGSVILRSPLVIHSKGRPPSNKRHGMMLVTRGIITHYTII